MIDFAPSARGANSPKGLAPLAGGSANERQEMAYEHKLQAKLDYFAKMKHDAAMCLVEMGAKLENEHVEPDSKAGMIALVAYVKRHQPTVEEEITADMAWKRWNEACIQHGKYLALMEAEKAQAGAAAK